jgi:hypothetical protein
MLDVQQLMRIPSLPFARRRPQRRSALDQPATRRRASRPRAATSADPAWAQTRGPCSR